LLAKDHQDFGKGKSDSEIPKYRWIGQPVITLQKSLISCGSGKSR